LRLETDCTRGSPLTTQPSPFETGKRHEQEQREQRARMEQRHQ
jgi:hypothetical protein